MQLFEDLQFAALETGSDISLSRGVEIMTAQAVELAALNDVTDSVTLWTPTHLLSYDDEVAK